MLGVLLGSLIGGLTGLVSGTIQRRKEEKIKAREAGLATEELNAVLEQRKLQAIYNAVDFSKGSPAALISETKRKGDAEIAFYRNEGLTNPFAKFLQGIFGSLSTPRSSDAINNYMQNLLS